MKRLLAAHLSSNSRLERLPRRVSFSGTNLEYRQTPYQAPNKDADLISHGAPHTPAGAMLRGFSEMESCGFRAIAKIEACRVALSQYLHHFRLATGQKDHILPQLKFYLKEGKSLVRKFNECELKEQLFLRLDMSLRSVEELWPTASNSDLLRFRRIGTNRLIKSHTKAVKEYEALLELIEQAGITMELYRSRRSALSQSLPPEFRKQFRPAPMQRPKIQRSQMQRPQVQHEQLWLPQTAQPASESLTRAVVTYREAKSMTRERPNGHQDASAEFIQVRRLGSASSDSRSQTSRATQSSRVEGALPDLMPSASSELPVSKSLFKTFYKVDDYGRHVERKSGKSFAHLLEALGISGFQVGDRVRSMTIEGQRAQTFDPHLFMNALRNSESVSIRIGRGRGSFKVQPDPYSVRSYLVQHPLKAVADPTVFSPNLTL